MRGGKRKSQGVALGTRREQVLCYVLCYVKAFDAPAEEVERAANEQYPPVLGEGRTVGVRDTGAANPSKANDQLDVGECGVLYVIHFARVEGHL